MTSTLKRLFHMLMISTLWIAMLVVMLMIGMHYGEKKGLAAALSTNPVSEELELTCAGLWVGELNKKQGAKSGL